MPVKLIVFDIEIATPIEECSKGWQSYDEMGISVMCAWEGSEAPMRFFDRLNILDGIAYLNSADVLGGFNTLNFDLRVLEGTCGRLFPGTDAPDLASLRRIPHLDVLDLLVQSQFGVGIQDALKVHEGYEVFGGGKKLNHVAKATLGLSKSSTGVEAPQRWQAGRIAEVYDYCARDVWIEWQLVDHVIRRAYVLWGLQGYPKLAYLTVPEEIASRCTPQT